MWRCQIDFLGKIIQHWNNRTIIRDRLIYYESYISTVLVVFLEGSKTDKTVIFELYFSGKILHVVNGS